MKHSWFKKSSETLSPAYARHPRYQQIHLCRQCGMTRVTVIVAIGDRTRSECRYHMNGQSRGYRAPPCIPPSWLSAHQRLVTDEVLSLDGNRLLG